MTEEREVWGDRRQTYRSVGSFPLLVHHLRWEVGFIERGMKLELNAEVESGTALFTAAGSDLCAPALPSLSCWWTLLSEYLLGPLKADECLTEEKAYSVTPAFLCKCVCVPQIPSCNWRLQGSNLLACLYTNYSHPQLNYIFGHMHLCWKASWATLRCCHN